MAESKTGPRGGRGTYTLELVGLPPGASRPPVLVQAIDANLPPLRRLGRDRYRHCQRRGGQQETTNHWDTSVHLSSSARSPRAGGPNYAGSVL